MITNKYALPSSHYPSASARETTKHQSSDRTQPECSKKNNHSVLPHAAAVNDLKSMPVLDNWMTSDEYEAYLKTRPTTVERIADSSTVIPMYQRDPFSDYFLSHANGQFSLMERVLGLEQGSGMNDLVQQMKEQSLTWRDLVADFPDRTQYFTEAADAATNVLESLQNKLDELTEEAGIEIIGDWTLTVNADGSFAVNAEDATDELTSLLENNRQLLNDVLQAGALQTLSEFTDFGMTDTALDVEYVLLDKYLTDNLGYGMADLDFYNIPKHREEDEDFDKLLENDIVLQKQLDKFRSVHYKESSFSTSITIPGRDALAEALE